MTKKACKARLIKMFAVHKGLKTIFQVSTILFYYGLSIEIWKQLQLQNELENFEYVH